MDKAPDIKNFLKEQILLPPEKRSKEFKEYVETSYKSPDPEDSVNTPEEKSFIRYLQMLDINQASLLNKKILDLG